MFVSSDVFIKAYDDVTAMDKSLQKLRLALAESLDKLSTVRLKRFKAVYSCSREPVPSYRASPAIWDHTVLPATRRRWTCGRGNRGVRVSNDPQKLTWGVKHGFLTPQIILEWNIFRYTPTRCYWVYIIIILYS